MLHFAPDFQLLILPSCFDVLFLYSLFFSQRAQGEKLGTHWLPLSKPTFLGLFDKWVSATTPHERSYYYWLLLLLVVVLLSRTHNSILFDSVPSLLLVSHYFTTKLGLDQKTQFGRKHKEKFEVSPWIWIILSDFMKIYKVVFFISLLNHFFLFGNDLLPKLL